MDFGFAWPFLIPIIAIIGGCTIAIVATIAKARVREAEIRERIAMIEKGLVPPPEVDPGAFDRALSRADHIASFNYRHRGSGRHRRTGITLMGIGLGMAVLIGFTSGETSNGIGVGGFIMIIGLAFFINSLFEDAPNDRWAPPPSSSRPPSTPASSSDQPRP